MNQAMRQRLLGILVLVALASILLPLLLDFRSGYPVDTGSRIPPPPEIPPQPLPQLEAPAPTPEDDQSAAPPQQLFQLPEAAPGAAALPGEPGLDDQGLPRAWVLQLGAFQEERNALELRDRLVAAGHRAFVQRSAAGEPIAYRVFVGPKMTRDQLSAAQRELEREFKVKPLVVPFAP